MATPRLIRRLAFQALYQLDAVADADVATIRASIDMDEELKPGEIDKAIALAQHAYDHRTEADTAVAELAPEWPVHRQPAVDRALLRLAHYEMTSGTTPPKAAVAEAVRLAREFSTEKSPAFVNAILDKLLKRIPSGPEAPDAVEPLSEETEG